MSLLYDDQQNAIAEESRRVLDARTSRDRLLTLLEQTNAYDAEFWTTAVEQGWTALAISEANGGIGLGLIDLGLVAQAAGEGPSGAPFLASGDAAAQALNAFDDSDIRAQYLAALASGEWKAAIAFAEDTDPLPRNPTVVLSGGKLSGVKEGVTAGLRADFAIVWALHQDQPALVLVDLAEATREPVDSFDNSRLFADLAFAGTPAKLIVQGEAARGVALLMLARMAVVVAHEQTGGAEALLREGQAFSLTRKAFGQPIAAFQSVKHRLAELYALIEVARANCIHAASRDGRTDFIQAAAAARISATEAYDTAARDVVQLHGGIGVTWEAGLHLHTRRARSLAIEGGNMFFWEDVLVEQLTGVAA